MKYISRYLQFERRQQKKYVFAHFGFISLPFWLSFSQSKSITPHKVLGCSPRILLIVLVCFCLCSRTALKVNNLHACVIIFLIVTFMEERNNKESCMHEFIPLIIAVNKGERKKTNFDIWKIEIEKTISDWVRPKSVFTYMKPRSYVHHNKQSIAVTSVFLLAFVLYLNYFALWIKLDKMQLSPDSKLILINSIWCCALHHDPWLQCFHPSIFTTSSKWCEFTLYL